MCGRFDQHTLSYRYAGYIDAMVRVAPEEPPPRYNVAPQSRVWVGRATRDGGRELTPLLWGLVSYWDDDPKKAVKPINARSESAASRPMFRKLMAIHRCVVPVDGFYEWRKTPAGRLPYYIRLADDAPMLLAGLWDRWRRGDADTIESFTILTTPANPSIATLHDRMPAIIDRADVARWLDRDEQDPAMVQGLLEPYPMERLRAHPVSRSVNSASSEGAELIAPVEGEPVA
ncbi:MAG TPA: SOS response-associated peptidase [Casimicrobiaceae bacterium]|nr:SOS response-associated peptidase [Casimicrobiaceae bacterium]